MTSYEMRETHVHTESHASTSHEDDTSTHLNGFYRCLIGLSAVQLFCGIAALALGIANAIVCGMLGSIGYGIWGSAIVSRISITHCLHCLLTLVIRLV